MKVKFKTIHEDMIFDGAPSHKNLTSDNVYRVIEFDEDAVRVMNDYGEPVLYPLSWFSIVDDRWPSDWDVTLEADGERCAGPTILRENYFWERYFDGDKSAVRILKQRLREWDKYEI